MSSVGRHHQSLVNYSWILLMTLQRERNMSAEPKAFNQSYYGAWRCMVELWHVPIRHVPLLHSLHSVAQRSISIVGSLSAKAWFCSGVSVCVYLII